MEMWSMDKAQLEETLDTAKVEILNALVSEGALTNEMADFWAKTHAPVMVKQIWFKRLINAPADIKDDKQNGYFVRIVKLIGKSNERD